MLALTTNSTVFGYLMTSKMNTSTKQNNLTAVVSFEGSLKKLYSCLQALDTWVPQIIIVLPENKEIENFG